MDEGLKDMDRSERIPAMNLPIGLGDQNRRYYYHAKLNDENIFDTKEAAKKELFVRRLRYSQVRSAA